MSNGWNFSNALTSFNLEKIVSRSSLVRSVGLENKFKILIDDYRHSYRLSKHSVHSKRIIGVWDFSASGDPLKIFIVRETCSNWWERIDINNEDYRLKHMVIWRPIHLSVNRKHANLARTILSVVFFSISSLFFSFSFSFSSFSSLCRRFSLFSLNFFRFCRWENVCSPII